MCTHQCDIFSVACIFARMIGVAKLIHQRCQLLMWRWYMLAHFYSPRPPSPGRNFSRRLALLIPDFPHMLGKLEIKLPVDGPQECGRKNRVLIRCLIFDPVLHIYMCQRLPLQISFGRVSGIFSSLRGTYFMRACVVAFDQIRIIGIDDGHVLANGFPGGRR